MEKRFNNGGIYHGGLDETAFVDDNHTENIVPLIGLNKAIAIVDGHKIPLDDIRIKIDDKSYSMNICTKEEIELPTRAEVSD